MSTGQENFDDLIKSKLDANEFAFNEANWDKAEVLIAAAEKKRKRRIIAFILFVGLIIGVCLMIPFVDFGREIDSKKNVAPNISSANKNEIYSSEELNKTGVKQAQKTTDVSSKIETKNEPSVPMQSEEVIKPKTAQEEKEGVSNSKPTQQNTTELLVTENKKEKGHEAKIKAGQGIGEGNENNSHDFIAKNNQATKPADSKKEDTKTELLSDKVTKPVDDVQKTDTAIALPIAEIKTAKDSVIATSKDSAEKTKADSAVTKKNNNAKPKQGFVFGIDAGASYALGWAYNSTKEVAGFNPVFGINVTHFFTKTWSVLVGLQYNSLAHLSYSNYTSNSVHYGFGYNQIKIIVTPTVIKYLSIPVKMQFWFNNKNSLSIGANALFLLNTNSKVETITNGDFMTPVTTSTTKAGYRDGLSSLDVQPALAYKYCFAKGFSINAEMYYGLIDVKNNNVFAINKAEHNSGFKLTLSYIFIGRNRSVCGLKDYIK